MLHVVTSLYKVSSCLCFKIKVNCHWVFVLLHDVQQQRFKRGTGTPLYSRKHLLPFGEISHKRHLWHYREFTVTSLTLMQFLFLLFQGMLVLKAHSFILTTKIQQLLPISYLSKPKKDIWYPNLSLRDKN